MKKIFFSVVALLFACGAGAQTVYDAVNIAQRDLNGTARFVGMGGAMGALGGDLSTMGTNPAGIGIYRSNDASVTFGYNINSTDANYQGNTFSNNKYRWSLDNAGFVYAMKIGNQTSLRYVNFGFSYNHSKSLYRNLTMSGLMGAVDNQYLSQVRLMEQQAVDYEQFLRLYYPGENPLENLHSADIWNDNDAGWLGAMGYKGFLLDDELHAIVPDEVDAYFQSRERGGVDRYDFNVAFNFNDRIYLGATLGAYDVDYKKYALYDEDYGNGEGYSLENDNRIYGSGFDLKLGLIARPFEDSPLRIGLSLHTPTWYNLTLQTGSVLNSVVFVNSVRQNDSYSANTFNDLNGPMVRDFSLITPWVFNASLGYTVGSMLALGAEYEYEDYSSMKFKYPEGDEMAWETDEAKNCLKGTHTLRLGMEMRPVSHFALRAGYNYTTAAFNDNAIKALPVNSINTDTEFCNTKSQNIATLGLGYRGKMFYADLAYKYSWQKADFYPFYNELNNDICSAPATKVDNKRSQVMLTLGVRF